jgi:hypothetical protein
LLNQCTIEPNASSCTAHVLLGGVSR